MAISVSYGPISAALKLAQESGSGQNWWKRQQAESEVQDRLARRSQQTMQLQQMEEERRAREISQAVQQQQFQQQEARQQQQFQAGEQQRQWQRGQQESEASRVQEQQAAFQQRFGMGQQELQASQKQEQEQRLQQSAASRSTGSNAARLGSTVKQLRGFIQQQQKTAADLMGDIMADPKEKSKQIQSINTATQRAQQQLEQLEPAYMKLMQQISNDPEAYQGYEGSADPMGPPPATGPTPATPQQAGGQMTQQTKYQLMGRLPLPLRDQLEMGIPIEKIQVAPMSDQERIEMRTILQQLGYMQ